MKFTTIFSLKNKIILITGAAGLLGQHHAEAVLKYEGKVILIDINKNIASGLLTKPDIDDNDLSVSGDEPPAGPATNLRSEEIVA